MNDHIVPSRSGSAPGFAQQARGLVRWVGTKNPFYVISALLVFVGLRISFQAEGKVFPTWALLLSLAGYTLLLAMMACLLVRYGNVWQDVRTCLLLVVMMFVATTVFFDDIIVNHPVQGVLCSVWGFLFAVVVSEGLLRGMRLSLPWLFRGPYYALLAVFFLYPAALSPIVRSPNDPALMWALFGFSPVAAAVFLALVPAARRGRAYLAKNGSPWRWPLYPWTLFGMLAGCAAARSYYLCLSIHYLDMPGHYRSLSSSIFGPYFLVPLGLAMCVLMLEIGLAARKRSLQRLALVLPLGILLMALVGHRAEAVYQHFLSMVVSGMGGSPLYLSLIGVAVFYAVAALRGIPLGTRGLSLCLGALAVVGPGTITLGGLVAPRAWPILAVAAVQACSALARGGSARWFWAAVWLILGAAIGLADSSLDRGVILAHGLLGTALVLGAVCDDDFARLLRGAGMGLLVMLALGAMVAAERGSFDVAPEILWAYPLALGAIAWIYGSVLKVRGYMAAAAADLAVWILALGWQAYGSLRPFIAGLSQLAWGLACFVLAALISFAKAGILQTWLAGWRAKNYRPFDG